MKPRGRSQEGWRGGGWGEGVKSEAWGHVEKSQS